MNVSRRSCWVLLLISLAVVVVLFRRLADVLLKARQTMNNTLKFGVFVWLAFSVVFRKTVCCRTGCKKTVVSFSVSTETGPISRVRSGHVTFTTLMD